MFEDGDEAGVGKPLASYRVVRSEVQPEEELHHCNIPMGPRRKRWGRLKRFNRATAALPLHGYLEIRFLPVRHDISPEPLD
jgi:hypothetical protein